MQYIHISVKGSTNWTARLQEQISITFMIAMSYILQAIVKAPRLRESTGFKTEAPL
jgi:hypothetical protein